MIGKKTDIKPFPKTETRLGEGTSLKGTLRFSKSLAIRGHFEGKIISEGFLFVDEGAEVKADLEVGSVIIGGTVRGNVTARGRLEMLPSGRVYGNVRAGLRSRLWRRVTEFKSQPLIRIARGIEKSLVGTGPSPGLHALEHGAGEHAQAAARPVA